MDQYVERTNGQPVCHAVVDGVGGADVFRAIIRTGNKFNKINMSSNSLLSGIKFSNHQLHGRLRGFIVPSVWYVI